MQYERVAPAMTEDEHADLVVRRGRSAGAGWVVSSLLALGVCLGVRSPAVGLGAMGACVVLLGLGLRARARYWREARRRLGDATVQRARWRQSEADRESPERIVWAIAAVALLIGAQLWQR